MVRTNSDRRLATCRSPEVLLAFWARFRNAIVSVLVFTVKAVNSDRDTGSVVALCVWPVSTLVAVAVAFATTPPDASVESIRSCYGV